MRGSWEKLDLATHKGIVPRPGERRFFIDYLDDANPQAIPDAKPIKNRRSVWEI
jgi:hypothetical protein